MKWAWDKCYHLFGRMMLLSAGLLQFGCATPVVTEKVKKFTVKKDLVYTTAGAPEKLAGDFYRPILKGQKKSPVVLLVHGGSWAENDNRYQMEGIAKKLAMNGFAVFNVTYRLAPKYNFPAPIDDLEQALVYLKKNETSLNIDLENTSVYGYSAGGQLVEILATRKMPKGIKIKSVVAGGTPHFLRLDPDFPVVKAFIGKSFTEAPETYKAATPVDAVSKDFPPVFIYHGSKDALVPPIHVHKMTKRLSELGIEHKVYWNKGRGHVSGFLLPRESINEAIKFIDSKVTR